MDVGKMLGNYEVVAEIGSGGMATVYRGHQPSLNRQVAIKVLAGELARDASFRERFSREARSIAQLAHPNILPVYDSGEDKETGAPYFVMQLVEGGTLAQRMGQPMDIEAVVRITAQLARALDYAHRRGVVHRDVKPANVLLTPDGHPLLSDFGISRMVAETHLTQTGVSLGTPAYMSPEQAQGGAVDQRTDIYALGVIAYEMLTGRLPFQADTPVGMLHQHAYELPPPLRAFRPDVSRPLEKVLMRALAKEPSGRYASAGEFADAIEQAASARWQIPLPQFLRRATQKTSDPAKLVLAPTVRTPPSPAPASPPRQPARPARPSTPAGRAGMALLGLGRWLIRTLLILLTVLIIVALVLVSVGVIVVGMLAEQTIARQNWKLDEVDAGWTYDYRRSHFEAGLQAAIEPYTLGAVTGVHVTFDPPETIVAGGYWQGNQISLQVRVREVDGVPNVQIERFNNVPLYVIGGILSGRVNSGFKQAWQDAPIRIQKMQLTTESIEATYRRR